MFLAGSLLSRGQPVPAAESAVPARTYHLLREDDDWSFLADPGRRQEFWDAGYLLPWSRQKNSRVQPRYRPRGAAQQRCTPLSSHCSSTFALIAFDLARNGHTQCRCPETRNPGSDDDGPDANDYRHRRGFFARERRQSEIGETGCGGRRNVLGCGVGCGRRTLPDLSGPVACDRNLRRVRCRVISLRADVRQALTQDSTLCVHPAEIFPSDCGLSIS